MAAAGSVTVRSAQAVRVRRGTARFGKSRRSRCVDVRLVLIRRGGHVPVGSGMSRWVSVRRSRCGRVRPVLVRLGVAVTVCYGAVGFGLLRLGGLGQVRLGRVRRGSARRSRLVAFRLGAVGCGEAVMDRQGRVWNVEASYGNQGPRSTGRDTRFVDLGFNNNEGESNGIFCEEGSSADR